MLYPDSGISMDRIATVSLISNCIQINFTQRFLLYLVLIYFSQHSLQFKLRTALSRELTPFILSVKLVITCQSNACSMEQECEADLGHKLGQACNMQVTPAACRPRPNITCPLGINFVAKQKKGQLNIPFSCL